MQGKIYYLKHKDFPTIRYIGQTINSLQRRKIQHLGEAKYDLRNNRPLTYKNKWLLKNFSSDSTSLEIGLIEECSLSILDSREIYWISYYSSPKLTNLDLGGRKSNRIMSEETCKKISEGKLGSKNGMFGKRYKKTDEQIKICRLNMINSKKFQDSRKSQTYKDKISQLQKVDDWLLLDENYNILKIFNNSIEVAAYLGCTRGNVKNARRDKRKLCKQYWIMYKKDYNENKIP